MIDCSFIFFKLDSVLTFENMNCISFSGCALPLCLRLTLLRVFWGNNRKTEEQLSLKTVFNIERDCLQIYGTVGEELVFHNLLIWSRMLSSASDQRVFMRGRLTKCLDLRSAEKWREETRIKYLPFPNILLEVVTGSRPSLFSKTFREKFHWKITQLFGMNFHHNLLCSEGSRRRWDSSFFQDTITGRLPSSLKERSLLCVTGQCPWVEVWCVGTWVISQR